MFERIKKIMSPEEAMDKVPLPKNLQEIKKRRDEIVKDIIAGRDKRLLVIVGPCSADSEDPVCDYVSRLAKLSEEVQDKIFIVPRIYTNKPRTRGEGYKGMLHNPDPHSNVIDIQEGILTIRKMHVRAIKESGLSAADEMLYPDNAEYCMDLLSYIAVGARSSENQQHRLVASGFDMAVGVKNPMNGSLPVLINSIYASQLPNEFKLGEYQVRTQGNEYAHAILRGSVDIFGNNIANYHYEDVMRFYNMYYDQHLKNPAVIIDTNHSNSGKDPFQQIRIVKEVAGNMRHCDNFKQLVKGFLIESYIEDGNQPLNGCVYGKSITDACLGWTKTQRLIYDLAERL